MTRKAAAPIIFLDIDGVLNDHEPWPNGYCGIKASCAFCLNKILAETEASIVVSSAWRYMVPDAMTLQGFEYMLLTHGVECKDRVVGVTCRDEEIDGRGLQIRHWLNENGGDRDYVVLDDLDLGISAEGHPFVRTDSIFGLTFEDAARAVAILKGVPV